LRRGPQRSGSCSGPTIDDSARSTRSVTRNRRSQSSQRARECAPETARSRMPMILWKARLWLVVFSAILGLSVLGRCSSAAEPQGAGQPSVCASRPDLIGPCFEVRGRLSFWNGAPSARIWPVRTNRLIGVHDDVLPDPLAAEIRRFDSRNRFDTEVWADFTLCPFTHYRKGRMQFVCIEAWRNATFRHRTD